MRVVFEARISGGVRRVELDVQDDNWFDEQRNAVDRRRGVIEAANVLLRSLNLDEIMDTP